MATAFALPSSYIFPDCKVTTYVQQDHISYNMLMDFKNLYKGPPNSP